MKYVLFYFVISSAVCSYHNKMGIFNCVSELHFKALISTKIIDLCDMTLRIVVRVYRSFRGTRCHHLQTGIHGNSRLCPRRWCFCTRLHSVICQQTGKPNIHRNKILVSYVLTYILPWLSRVNGTWGLEPIRIQIPISYVVFLSDSKQ